MISLLPGKPLTEPPSPLFYACLWGTEVRSDEERLQRNHHAILHVFVQISKDGPNGTLSQRPDLPDYQDICAFSFYAGARLDAPGVKIKRGALSKLDLRIEAVYTDPPGTTVRQGGTPYCRVPVSCYARGHSSWLSSSAIKSAVVLLLLSIWFPLQHFMRASFLFVRMLGVFYTLHHLGLKRISLLEQLVNTLGVRSWDVG